MQPTWHPTPGQIALIEVAGTTGLCLTGVVLDPEPGDHDDAVRVDLGAAAPLPEGTSDVLVSFFQADGLYQLKATAAMAAHRTATLEIRDLDRIQRRSASRTRVALPLSMTALDGPGEFLTVVGITVDIGTGGCRVRTTKPFPSGIDPTVTIDLDGGHTVVVSAEVVSVTERPDGYEYRLAFGEIDELGAKLLADAAH
jgi:c-di-GMP-binding flagellar brake protein YcgR